MAYAAGWLLDVYMFIYLSLNNLCPLFIPIQRCPTLQIQDGIIIDKTIKLSVKIAINIDKTILELLLTIYR